MRITLIAERLAAPFDEGIKNLTLNLLRALRQEHAVQALTVYGQDLPERDVHNVVGNKLFLGGELSQALRDFRPEGIVYVPTACATLGSFVRARALSVQAGGVPLALVALQVRRYGVLARALMPALAPTWILVQSERTARSLAALGERVAARTLRLPPAVDLERFSPVDKERCRTLRQRWQIAPEAFVLLHAGHLNRGRGVQDLARMARRADEQMIVVGSRSTPHDPELVRELRVAGVRVIDQTVEDIAELYQLADCYLFPVRGETSSIDLPLSVLEAMACDLPVVARPFGALPRLFGAAAGVHFAEDVAAMRCGVDALREAAPTETRRLVCDYGWDGMARALVRDCFQGGAGDRQ